MDRSFLASIANTAPVALRAATVIAPCLFALAACQSGEPPQQTTAEADVPPASGPASVPYIAAVKSSPFSSTSADAAAFAADDFDELLQRYPATQQTIIKTWYSDFAEGSMSFGTNAQWQWMRQHDYPTPADVLRASLMTDTQLRDLATHGNTKANFFHLSRLLANYTQADKAASIAAPDRARLHSEMTAAMHRALASGSAFAGYMYGGYYAALQGKGARGIGTACGLTWTMTSGDQRPMFTNPHFQLGFPGVSGVQTAAACFDMFAAAARLNPYFQKAYRGHGGLMMPSRWQHNR